MKDIYKELLDTKDIKGYTQEYPVKDILSYPSNLFCYLFDLKDILGYLRILKDILGYLFGANSQMMVSLISHSLFLCRHPS
jgi:hypothetical protein